MNGVTRISSEQDVMMITFTEADTASALADALTAFAQKGVVVDMICQSAPRAATIDFSFTMPASYFESAMQTGVPHGRGQRASYQQRIQQDQSFW